MAVPVLINEATSSLPKLQIEALLSVSPLKMTEPRQVRQVLMSDTNTIMNSSETLLIRGCYQIVLYYEKLDELYYEGFLAGWIVESLGRALVEHPLLAGRLQRKGHTENKELLLEIVSNDSGVRICEAQFPMTLSDFLALNEKEHLEAELVFWKDIDENNPEFSPLSYVQVTQFDCGGYSIGISCSLLLADVLVVENFLKKWAEIHNNMLPQNKEEIKAPIFCHPLLIQKYEPSPGDVITPTPSDNGAHTMVFNFKVTAEEVNFNKELWRELAMLCVAEAEQKLKKKMGSNFYVFVKESSEVIKIGWHPKSGYSMLDLTLKNQIIGATWNDFGDYDVTFHEGNKPVIVSRWIGSVADGHVMVIPRPEENVSAVIIVSFPFEKEL